MIASIRGAVEATGLDFVVLNVGGLGVKVLTTPATVSSLATSNEGKLYTELIVKEDSLTLYGFESVAEKDTFVALLGVSGVGPRTALAALTVLNPSEIRSAIESEDIAVLQRIPGIGKKSAARMLLELNGKLASIAADTSVVHASSTHVEVEAALEQLGWTKSAAKEVLDRISSNYSDSSSLLRAALQELGQKNG